MEIVLGFRKFKSKKGTDCCVLQVQKEFSDLEIKYGAVGTKAVDVWVPVTLQSIVTKDCIGSTCHIAYAQIGNSFQVVDISFEN